MTSRGVDLTGQRFNRLVAQKRVDQTKNKTWRWLCRCDCGSNTIVAASALRSLKTQSCGCARSEFARNQKTHGMTKSRTYITWKSMWARCTNPNSPDFPLYGGRGIGIDPAWKDFEVFLRDMGERPVGRSLDREKTDLGYSKSNCRWATAKEQANNRRNNVINR